MHNNFNNLIAAISKGAPIPDEVCRIYHGRGDNQR